MGNVQIDLVEPVMLGGLERPSVAAAETESLPHVRAPGTSLSLVREADDFLALEDQWRILEASANVPRGVFQSFDWLSEWVRNSARMQEMAPLRIALGYRDGRLVFAWPLMVCRCGPLKVLRWMSEPLAQYGDVLSARGECPKTWMADAMRELAKTQDIDAVRLRHVREDAASAPFLKQAFRSANMSEQAPWLDLSEFGSEQAYDARYSSTQRKRRKKIRKALEDDFGAVTFRLLKPGPDTDRAIAAALAEKSRWIEARGRQNRALNAPQVSGFLQQFARRKQGTAQLVVSELQAGGRPISWEIGLRHNATHFGFITSHVTALTDYSPARLHMDLSQRQALNDGMMAFDLMIPNDAYKESWCSARTLAQDYYLPLTNAGRIYGRLYLENLRPLLRRAYYRMPPKLLKLLKPLIGH